MQKAPRGQQIPFLNQLFDLARLDLRTFVVVILVFFSGFLYQQKSKAEEQLIKAKDENAVKIEQLQKEHMETIRQMGEIKRTQVQIDSTLEIVQKHNKRKK